MNKLVPLAVLAGAAAVGRRALPYNASNEEIKAYLAEAGAEKQANRPFRIKFGAPSRGGRFKWLAAGRSSQITQKDWIGFPIPRQSQLEEARREAARMVKVFARDYPGQGWVVGIFQGRRLVERFPVDAEGGQGRRAAGGMA